MLESKTAEAISSSSKLTLSVKAEGVHITARNEIRKVMTRNASRCRGTGDSDMRAILEAQPDHTPGEDDWDRGYQLNLFHWG